jgi:post-segregation antitoxin (ccd killing protein)
MDRETLATLRRMIRPVTLRGAQTMERASSLASLNVEISRFHAAVRVAERMLELSGTLDEGIERELVARARHLAWLREGMERSRASCPAGVREQPA